MKYINHMTASGDDEKHQALMARVGLRGYGAYWIIAEKIGAQIRPESCDTSMGLTWQRWGNHLGVEGDSARRLIRSMAEVGLIELEEVGKIASVNMPNILKYADEYTKRVGIKSGQTPDTTREKLRKLSGTPALPALPEQKKDLKDLRQPVDNSGVLPLTDRAVATGGVLEAPPAAALDPGRFKPKDFVGNMTPEELIAAARSIPKGTR